MSPVDVPLWPDDSVEARIERRAQDLERPRIMAVDPEGRALSSLFIAGAPRGLGRGEIKDLIGILVDGPYPGLTPSNAHAALRATTAPRGGEILYSRPANTEYGPGVRAHEAGHVVDFRGNVLSAYNALADEARKTLIRDQMIGVARRAARSRDGRFDGDNLREVLADGISFYMQSPDEMKTLAPDAARFIRDVVNQDPVLSPVITFAQAPAGKGLLGILRQGALYG